MTLEELGELQARFGAQMGARDVVLAHLAPWLRDDASTLHRFARYGEALRHHHERSLTLVYPVLHALVGEAFFRALAHSYGTAHASCDGDLSGFGAQLPEFVSTYPGAQRYPYFADVARVEWSLHQAHGAADAQPLTVADIAKADPSSVGGWVLRLHPAVALHACAWRVGAIVLAHREPSNHAFPPSIAEPARVLVYRADWRATLREIGASEWAALDTLSRGATLGDALESALTPASADVTSTTHASVSADPSAMFVKWVAGGLLIRD
ncbi:DNA-binding domain-containing protein [Trinickia dinghuensis]|uniref:HvfC/BufC N-terminal domain-containing protein n=1 Tax=Trinickia dinghuensis TaxID=2291023 RepID=UPI0015F18A3B|nr:DNA-binding domain-containing protein [Trinickia dinghuensis]